MIDGELPLLPQQLAQRAPVRERHHIVRHTVDLSRLQQRHERGRLHRSGDPNLAEEALRGDRISKHRAQHLEGNGVFVTASMGEPDSRHPTASNLSLKLKTLTKSRKE
ncbi:MAG: hypothetical protein IPP90_16160 [Gemmatimonadaceae bacterium]|nr:hypothetical protein [Gemmatimonadaceae bacterium]